MTFIYMIRLLLIAGLQMPSLIYAQPKREVDLADLLDEWVSTEDSVLIVEGVTIVKDRISSYTEGLPEERGSVIWTYLYNKHKDRINIDADGRINLNKGLRFDDVEMDDLYLTDISFTSLEIRNSKFEDLELDSVALDELEFFSVEVENDLLISFCSFKKINISANTPYLVIEKSALPKSMWIFKSKIGELYFSENWDADLNEKLTWDSIYYNDFFTDYLPILNDIDLTENISQIIPYESEFIYVSNDCEIGFFSFENNILPNHRILIAANGELIWIKENIIGLLEINRTIKFSELVIRDNLLINGITLDKYLAEVSFEINWPGVKNKLLVMEDSLYTPKTQEAVKNMENYESLSKSYSSLHSYYKSIGMTAYANECYIEWKDMQTARLKYIYKSQGGYKNLFQYNLLR